MKVEHSEPRVRGHSDPEATPILEPGHLDALWFQVTGTRCNLRCAHCFIACGPDNDAFDALSLEEVERRLEESVALGVREYYFTGGEPFLHPQIVEILTRALDYGPTTVLTNGTVLRPRQVRSLAAAAGTSRWSLEFRLSLDGFDAASNDALRGPGAFDRAMAGLELLLAQEFLPIITAVQTWDPARDAEVHRRFVEVLRARGYARPRVKTMPALSLGAEAVRSGSYGAHDRVTNGMLEGFDLDPLVCSHARVVTDRGVWVCPILLDAPDGNLGDDLARAARAPFALGHPACHTCWLHGAICSNPGSVSPETGIEADAPPLDTVAS